MIPRHLLWSTLSLAFQISLPPLNKRACPTYFVKNHSVLPTNCSNKSQTRTARGLSRLKYGNDTGYRCAIIFELVPFDASILSISNMRR